MTVFEKMDNRNRKFPKRIFATVTPEIYDALQRYGMSNIDILINNLLVDYFEKQESDLNGRNRTK